MEQQSDFRKELEGLLNRHGMEGGSDTPDFILADYLAASLAAFDAATTRRSKWYGHKGLPEILDSTGLGDAATTVVINGQIVGVKGEFFTYEEVVLTAFGTLLVGNVTVQYTRGGGDKPSGTLQRGQSVKVKDGMVFDAVNTSRA